MTILILLKKLPISLMIIQVYRGWEATLSTLHLILIDANLRELLWSARSLQTIGKIDLGSTFSLISYTTIKEKKRRRASTLSSHLTI
jgi:hypothetical protein